MAVTHQKNTGPSLPPWKSLWLEMEHLEQEVSSVKLLQHRVRTKYTQDWLLQVTDPNRDRQDYLPR